MSEQAAYLVYIGTYTQTLPHVRGRGEGIYIYRMDPASGTLTPAGLAKGIANPSFLALDPPCRSTRRRHLYAVSEVAEADRQPSGALSAFAVDMESGGLTLLNQELTHGVGPCYVSVDATGHWALVANYRSGSVAVLPILTGGRLGVASAAVQHQGSSINPQRQEGPHAHSIITDPTNRFALAADLGLDRILVYRFDAERGTLEPHSACAARPGAGPRHQAFHPNGRWLYATTELDSTIMALAWDGGAGADRLGSLPHGTLEPIGTYPMLPDRWAAMLPDRWVGESTAAHVAIDPAGRTLYASNRGHDSIAAFAIDEASGALTPLSHTPSGGRTPRHFALDPAGRFLLAANQDSDTVVTFAVDPDSGRLSPTGQVTPVPSPVCVQIVSLVE